MMKRVCLVLVILICFFQIVQVNAISKKYPAYDLNDIIYNMDEESNTAMDKEIVCFGKIPYLLVCVISFTLTVVVVFAIVATYKKIKLSMYANRYIISEKTEITNRNDTFIRSRTVRLKNSKRNSYNLE